VANSTTNLDQLVQSQASKEVTANALWDAMSQAATYGRRASTTSGLTWGFYGGRVILTNGTLTTSIANGTVLLTASATNRVVAEKSTGTVSTSTGTTNWDSANYWRLYEVVTGTATITSYTDHRPSSFFDTAGLGGSANGGVTPDGTEREITRSQAWHTQASTEDNAWRQVAWSPALGRAVAVSEGGTNRVMYSDDGVTWVAASASQANVWQAVTWSPELRIFCAVSADGTNRVMTSPDGITWTNRSASGTPSFRSVTWSPDRLLFVAVGTASAIQTSPDGITWTARTAGAAGVVLRDVAWSPALGLFATVSEDGGGGRAQTSPDGITWTARTMPGNSTWHSVEWGAYAGVFVATARTPNIATSADGITWTARSTALGANDLRGVTWSDELGLFVNVSNAGTLQHSPDGITWTAGTAPAANAWQWSAWCPALGMFVAVSNTGVGNRVMSSAGFVGRYTPTLTAVANVAASTAYPARWSRRGRDVTVNLQVDVDATAATTLTQLGISLPLSVNLASADQLAGCVFSHEVFGLGGAILADATNERAELNYQSESTNNRAFRGQFGYRI